MNHIHDVHMELWKCNCDLSCVACIRAGRRTVKVTQLSQIEQVLKGLGLLRHIHHAARETQKTKGRLNGFCNVVAIWAHTIAAICSKQTILEPIFCVLFLYFSVWLFFSPLLEKKVMDSQHTEKNTSRSALSFPHSLCAFLLIWQWAAQLGRIFYMLIQKRDSYDSLRFFFRKSMQNTTQNKQHRVIVAALVKKIVVSYSNKNEK